MERKKKEKRRSALCPVYGPEVWSAERDREKEGRGSTVHLCRPGLKSPLPPNKKVVFKAVGELVVQLRVSSCISQKEKKGKTFQGPLHFFLLVTSKNNRKKCRRLALNIFISIHFHSGQKRWHLQQIACLNLRISANVKYPN